MARKIIGWTAKIGFEHANGLPYASLAARDRQGISIGRRAVCRNAQMDDSGSRESLLLWLRSDLASWHHAVRIVVVLDVRIEELLVEEPITIRGPMSRWDSLGLQVAMILAANLIHCLAGDRFHFPLPCWLAKFFQRKMQEAMGPSGVHFNTQWPSKSVMMQSYSWISLQLLAAAAK
jgi:hypothetical protein